MYVLLDRHLETSSGAVAWCYNREVEASTVRVTPLELQSSRNIPEQDIRTNTQWTTQPFISSRSINCASAYGGNVISVGWNAKLYDPLRLVSYRSVEACVTPYQRSQQHQTRAVPNSAFNYSAEYE